MEQKDLDQLIEGAAESPQLEFKESCPWDAIRFIKDILAMANLRGGGYIIIGIKQSGNGFEREGVKEEHLITYDIDIMKDQINIYADPFVDFDLYKHKAKDNKWYVVIAVKEFVDIPIICKKDGRDLRKATIYYRNQDRRPESGPISNSYDLRNLLELAAVKMMKVHEKLGYQIETKEYIEPEEQILNDEKYNKEIDDLDHLQIIKKIKSRGYWKISVRPTVYNKERINNLIDCRDIIARNAVRLRGWPFPFIAKTNDKTSGILPGEHHYESWVDWDIHKELWRFYQSAQFITLRGLWEDWYKERGNIDYYDSLGEIDRLGVFHTLYFLTEIFEFLNRMVISSIYKGSILVSVELCNIKGRILWIDDPNRLPLWEIRKTGATSIIFSKVFSDNEIKEKGREIAIESSLYFFQRFDWNPENELLKEAQRKFLGKY